MRHTLENFLDFRRDLDTFHPDAILCTHWDPSGYVAAFATIGTGIPLFIVAHGTDLNAISARGVAYRVKRVLQRIAFMRSKKLIAVSHFTAIKAEALGVPTNKIRIIPNGIAQNGQPRTPRAEMNSTPRLLTVCRLVPRKGCDTVIEALPQLLNTYPSLTYTIVGQGPEHDRLVALIKRLNLDEHVVLLGQVDEAEKVRLYDSSDLFVMPARANAVDFEGFGLVFLEAMSHGLPVIGGASGGIPDVIEDGVTGSLVPPDDPAALAIAIRTLLSDKERWERYSAAALKRVRERFLWPDVANQYINEMIEVP
jgi:phosphatidylinositol alpha-1,6-mannosyltransferase